jgi:hypothetical protein
MTALPEKSIQRIAAPQEGEHWWTPSANPVKSLPNSTVTACRGESLLKHLHRVQGDDRLGTFGETAAVKCVFDEPEVAVNVGDIPFAPSEPRPGRRRPSAS